MPESQPDSPFEPEETRPTGSSRRVFFRQATTSLFVLSNIHPFDDLNAPTRSEPVILPTAVPTAQLRLTINRKVHILSVDTRTTLLDLLRDHLGLTGTKKGCNHGQCGACTILLDGERINACLALAVIHDGAKITTIEGITPAPDKKGHTRLHPMQAAFLKYDGFQCGYCTPGQICSAVGMLYEVKQTSVSAITSNVRRAGPVPLTDDEIRERMSGNICRCGAYMGIVAAIRDAAGLPANAER